MNWSFCPLGSVLLFGISACAAQDVLICPAYDFSIFSGEGYLNERGASLAFRFPNGTKRALLEIRPSFANSKRPNDNHQLYRGDSRIGGTLGYLHAVTIHKFNLDYGIEVGCFRRWITFSYLNSISTTRQNVLFVGPQIALRMAHSNWVQPMLSFHPFYDILLNSTRSAAIKPRFVGNQFGMSICLGIVFGIPEQRSDELER